MVGFTPALGGRKAADIFLANVQETTRLSVPLDTNDASRPLPALQFGVSSGNYDTSMQQCPRASDNVFLAIFVYRQ